jgi:hypothetical protein
MYERHRAPNLERMDEQQAQRFLEGMMSDLGADSGYEVRHEDFVMEMPQSGERIRGRKKMREFQRAYPASQRCGCAGCWYGRGCGWRRSTPTTVVGESSITCPSSN